MSNGVKAKIIPRIVMSITPLDVMLLPGTHTHTHTHTHGRAGLSVYKCGFLFTFLYISFRSFRCIFNSYDDHDDVYNYACRRRRRRRPVRSGDRRCAYIVYNNIQDNWCAHAYWRSIRASGAVQCPPETVLLINLLWTLFNGAGGGGGGGSLSADYLLRSSLLHWWWLFSRHHHLFSYYCRTRATL